VRLVLALKLGRAIANDLALNLAGEVLRRLGLALALVLPLVLLSLLALPLAGLPVLLPPVALHLLGGLLAAVTPGLRRQGLALLGLRVPVLVLAFIAEFFLFLNTGPLNAALIGCVPANLRSTSIAVNVLFIHAFGDAISPYLMGGISDLLGPRLAGTMLGETPEAAGLRLAIALTAVPLVFGGMWLLRGATALDRHPGGLSERDE
jgi:hypothetical protein